jgi:ribokinase
MTILVIGSSNTDLITTVKHFPAAGETIQGNSFLQAMGGKGANQAVAALKAGGDVKFITCLGTDPNGQNALKYYREQGLDVSSSLIVDSAPSGTAVILVDEKGENCIVVTPGANNLLSPAYIYQIQHEIKSCDMILLQMEIPYETIKAVCRLAAKHRKRVMLNVAPARPVDREMLMQTDILVVNETEAETISGLKIAVAGTDAVIDALLEMGAKTVVLTLGKQGSMVKNNQITQFMPAFPIEAVDSTAAGDTFCGALAASLTRGHEWSEALKFATAAAAISVTRMGAQPSIPTEPEIHEFLSQALGYRH